MSASTKIMAGLAAYKATRGLYEGGFAGAGLQIGAAVANKALAGSGNALLKALNINAGYSYAGGFSGGVGMGLGGAGQEFERLAGVNVGLNYNDQTGFGASIGYQGDHFNVGVGVSGLGGHSSGTYGNIYGGLTSGGQGDYLRGSLDLNYNYRDNSFGGGVSVLQDFSSFGNNPTYFDRSSTALNWNSEAGFSNQIQYTLSNRGFDAVTGFMQGMANNMANVWNGLGYMFGGRRPEEAYAVGAPMNGSFGGGGTPTPRGGAGQASNDEMFDNRENLSFLKDDMDVLSGFDPDTGTIYVVGSKYTHKSSDQAGNEFKVGYAKDEFGSYTEEVQYLMINGKEVIDGSIVKIAKNGQLEVVNANEVSRNSLVFVNGIRNNPEDGLNSIKYIQSVAEQDVYLVYNLTEGFGKDIANATTGLVGRNSETSQSVLTNLIKDGKVGTLLAHSQGSVISGNALIDAKKNNIDTLNQVNWVTFGGPIGFQNIPGGLNSGILYENFLDPVPGTLPVIGTLNAFGRYTAAFIHGYQVRSGGGIGHGFLDTYDNAFRDYWISEGRFNHGR